MRARRRPGPPTRTPLRFEADAPAGGVAAERPGVQAMDATLVRERYSTTTMSVPPRPKVSGAYISSAFGGGTTNVPGVVARAS